MRKPKKIPVTDEIWLAAAMADVPLEEAVYVARALPTGETECVSATGLCSF
jgi:hypothetical protein